jgi:3-methyladenine DNA glycosylase AlkC
MATAKKRAERTKRTGSSSIAKVPSDILNSLTRGEIETKTLSEGLAIDFDALAKHAGIRAQPLIEKGVVKRMREMSSYLEGWQAYRDHTSDTVRGWSAYRLAHDPKLSFDQKLTHMKRFAADAHFGVREWAWIALRDQLALNLEEGITKLTTWSIERDPNVRRFASEITRPRGVWCAHLTVLKEAPARGLPILEPLRADPSKYVRDSVANWLNDASKTQAAWVSHLAKRWKHESKTPETEAILKRALRSL